MRINRRYFMTVMSLLGVTAGASAAQKPIVQPNSFKLTKVLSSDQWMLQMDKTLQDDKEYSYIELTDKKPNEKQIQQFRALAETVFQRRTIELFG